MRPRLLLVAPVLLFGALVTSCSADDVGDRVRSAVDDVAQEAAAGAVGQTVTESLKQAGINLAEAPDCTSDLEGGADGLQGTVDCTSTTTDDKPVKATFDGTLDVGNCSGSLVVTVGEQKVVDRNSAGCEITGG